MPSGDDRRIEGAGTPEADWAGLATLPAIAPGELVAEGQRTVVVAPHPDDEILACGGFMLRLLEARREVVLVAVTDGAGSHPGSNVWTPGRLARERPRESREALQRLGAGAVDVQRLGLSDTRVAEQASRLLGWLGRFLRPDDVVVTTWRGDGHPDHEACGRICAQAVQAAGCGMLETPVWAWHWSWPGDPRVPWQRARRIVLTPDQLAAKRAAIEAHVSQLGEDASTGQGPVLPETALARLLRPFEVVLQ
ncbi:PIG-L family deacetylase [Halomonas sp. HP20-15]|uniref:PIG-L deacetylase family protein n=1 Tax=Halomonas sp. HP20-15 TaxID=3085901 RepID=UPI0029822861|nr:PIG-L family deacetylase [Halomonas sp. HP20-15]MDW5377979.1 PIG-L family deacetylase [Halomonas sp. HP20-15]